MTTRWGQRTFREALREVMEPYSGAEGSTILSLVVDVVVLLCIVASSVVIPLEWLYPEHEGLFLVLERVFLGVFVVEYLLRWYSSTNRLTYPFSTMAVIDLMAILPSVVFLLDELLVLRLVRGMRLLRLVRLVRLVRLLRLFRFGPLLYKGLVKTRIWLSAINYQYRIDELGRLFMWALIAWFVGANVVHMTEVSIVGDVGPFADYWRSYWNILIVLVSGIEDKEPQSLLGMIEVTVLLVVGIVVVGMVTGQIVSILVRRVQRAGKVAIMPPKARFEHHIVILGINRHLDNIIRQIHGALEGRHFIVVVHPEADELEVTDPHIYRKVFALTGAPVDARVLDAARVARSARVIVLGKDRTDHPDDARATDNASLMVTVAVNGIITEAQREARAKGEVVETIPMAVELKAASSLRYTHGLPHVSFIIGEQYGNRLMGQAVLSPGVTKVFDELVTFSDDDNELYTVPAPRELEGRTFRELQRYFLDLDDEAIVLVGIDRSPPELPNSSFVLAPKGDAGDDLVCSEGDSLVLIAYDRPSFAALGVEERWRGTTLTRTKTGGGTA